MKNKLLHALSNRPGPFLTPLFASTNEWHSREVLAEELALRRKLFLDLTETDYYLLMYLSIIHSYPELERLFDDLGTSYRVEDFPPRGVQIHGAEFVTNSLNGDYGVYTDASLNQLPVNLNYQIECLSPTSVRLTAKENRRIFQLTCQVSGDILRLNWPAEFPFAGPLRLTQDWVPGASVDIAVLPSHFPVTLLLDRIQGDGWLNEALVRFKILDAYLGSADHHERLALALSAVGLSNSAVYPA